MNRTAIIRNKKTGISLLALAVVVLTAVLVGILTGQAHAAVSPDVTWEKNYGAARDEVAYAVYSDDTGYTFTGSARADNGIAYHFWLARTDLTGNLLWEKKYAPDYLFKGEGRAVTKTSDGGYLIAGTRRINWDSLDKVYLIKTNDIGDVEWEKSVLIQNADGTVFGMQETSDGGYLIAGSVMFGGRTSGTQTDLLLVKVDADGNEVWKQTYGGPGWDWGYSIGKTKDGGFIIGGQQEVPGANSPYAKNVYVIKLNSEGNYQWEKTYGVNTLDSMAKSIVGTEDGGYVLTGYSGNSVLIMKLDSNGVKKWEKTFAAGIGYSVLQTDGGNYIATGRANGLGTYMVMVDKTGSRLWEKFIGSGGDTGYAIKKASAGGYIIAGSKAANGGDGHLIYVNPKVTATLGTSSTNVLNNGSVLIFATLYDDDGNLIKTGAADVKVKITDVADPVVLMDDGIGADLEAKDGVYCAWQQITNDKPVTIELLVNDISQDTKSVNVISSPQLVVVSDLVELHKLFKDNGLRADDDVNANKVPDYYDLLIKLSEYANKYNGIVFDLQKEITTANGYASNYGDLDYLNNCFAKGSLIDQFLKNVSDIYHYKYVAIIGDDRAVPFYRRADPCNDEKDYSREVSGTHGNKTLDDSDIGQIMTDVPYGSYDNTNPATVNQPRIDAGVGRIYANKPDELRRMIAAYDNDINLVPGERKAAIYSLDKDTVNWPLEIKIELLPVLKRQLRLAVPWAANPWGHAAGDPDFFFWYDGKYTKWTPDMVADSITNADITMFWAHAEHVAETTADYPYKPFIAGRTFLPANIDNLPDVTSHVLLNTGCHSGYSVGFQSTTGDYSMYNQSMVKGLLQKHVTTWEAGTCAQ